MFLLLNNSYLIVKNYQKIASFIVTTQRKIYPQIKSGIFSQILFP